MSGYIDGFTTDKLVDRYVQKKSKQ